MPFADVNLLKVPVDLPDEKLLLLSDVIPTGKRTEATPRPQLRLSVIAPVLTTALLLVSTGWHGNELSQVQRCSNVAVWGAGPVGSMAAVCTRPPFCCFLQAAPCVLLSLTQCVPVCHSPPQYLACHVRKAAHVVSIDHQPFRLEKAAQHGCDTINFDVVSDVPAELKKRMAPGPSSCIGRSS